MKDKSSDEDLAYVPPPGASGAPPEEPARPARRAARASDPFLDDLLAREPAPAAREPAPARRAEPAPARRAEPAPARRAEPQADEDEDEDEDVPASSGMEWWKQMFAEVGAFVLVGVLPYGMDMAFTVFGLTRTLLPFTLLGLIVAIWLHVFISLGQRHFLGQRGPIRFAGLLLLLINTGLNIYGMIPVLDSWLGPAFLGTTLPRDPGQWLPALGDALWGVPTLSSIWSARWNFVVTLPQGVEATGLSGWMLGGVPELRVVWPEWLAAAIIVTLSCAVVAWGAEPNLGWWYRRVRHMWRRRPR